MYEMACEIAGGLKYFMVFQLGSKPIVFHLEFHEIKLRGNEPSRAISSHPEVWCVWAVAGVPTPCGGGVPIIY